MHTWSHGEKDSEGSCGHPAGNKPCHSCACFSSKNFSVNQASAHVSCEALNCSEAGSSDDAYIPSSKQAKSWDPEYEQTLP